MYKTTYVCDCCGKEMQNPMYTLGLSTNSFCIQDRASWHYCNDCWGYIKKGLTKKNELSDLEKTVEELKEENKKLKKDASWCEQLFIPIFTAFMSNYYKNTGYGFTTTTTTSGGEKIIQAKPADDELFKVTVRHCYENTNENSLDYKQTVAPYSSLN